MDDFTPNMPEVVAELRDLFERYEQALIDKNVDVLDATFWDSPYTIRYAMNEHGYGFDAIHRHREARPPLTCWFLGFTHFTGTVSPYPPALLLIKNDSVWKF
jgi:hypothetical protein